MRAMTELKPLNVFAFGRHALAMTTVVFMLALPTSMVAQGIDNCASLLGSIAVELRYAHALPTSSRTTFICPRDTSALIGSGRQRILDSLGPPDATAAGDDAQGQSSWSYFFTGDRSAGRAPGVPELVFTFDEGAKIVAIRCGPSR